MELNNYRDQCHLIARNHGFHDNGVNFGERLMLVVSELTEALEADRDKKWCKQGGEAQSNLGLDLNGQPKYFEQQYNTYIRGSVEEELADALIRIFDIAGIYNIDLDFHVQTKMKYNENRPFLHGRNYG